MYISLAEGIVFFIVLSLCTVPVGPDHLTVSYFDMMTYVQKMTSYQIASTDYVTPKCHPEFMFSLFWDET